MVREPATSPSSLSVLSGPNGAEPTEPPAPPSPASPNGAAPAVPLAPGAVTPAAVTPAAESPAATVGAAATAPETPPRPVARAVVIVNPVAGSVTDEVVRRIEEIAARHVGELRMEFTEAAGGAEQLAAAAAAAGVDVVIAVGGDGTVREVVEGLTWRCVGRPDLLVMPGGTGNSNYRAHWGQLPWEAALDSALGGRAARRQLDVAWLVELDCAVLLGAGSGLIEACLRYAAEVGATGRERYRLALDLAVERTVPYPGRVLVDGDVVHEGPTSLVNVGGGRFRGGAYQVMPHSQLDDQLLDVCVVGDATPMAQLPELLRNGAHVQLSDAVYARGRTVTVLRTDGQPLAYEHDGESTPLEWDQFTITVMPGSVPVICHPAAPGFAGSGEASG